MNTIKEVLDAINEAITEAQKDCVPYSDTIDIALIGLEIDGDVAEPDGEEEDEGYVLVRFKSDALVVFDDAEQCACWITPNGTAIFDYEEEAEGEAITAGGAE